MSNPAPELEDLRTLDHGGLSGTSRRDHLDRWYTPLNAFLSIGPPRRRIEETAALIEARLPEPELRRAADPLLRDLLRTGSCRPHTVGGYEKGGLDVTPCPYRLVDARGEAHPRRFALGVPTEEVHWVTAAGARPGVDSVTLTDTDAVARTALRSLAPRKLPRTQKVELASVER